MKKTLMYLSAFIPMFAIMLIREVLIIITKIYECRAKWADFINPLLIGETILLLILIASFTIWMFNNKKRTTQKIIAISVNNRSAEYYLAYCSVFLLSLLNFSLLDIVDVITLALLMTALGIVYVKNGLFFMNPTINIFQSFIYEIEIESGEKKLVISKHKIDVGSVVEVDVSDFEFTFARKKTTDRNETNT